MSDELVRRLREAEAIMRRMEGRPDDDGGLCDEAAERIEALEAERDEALRRRDAWKARAENHVEIVNALRAKTAGQDSRTLGRALLGAAKMEAETALATSEAKVARLVEALRPLCAVVISRAAEDECGAAFSLPGIVDPGGVEITVGDVRRARAALASVQEGEG